MDEYYQYFGLLIFIISYAMFPIAFLTLFENFFTYRIPRILTNIFNMIQFLFIPAILFLAYQLSIPYKPALLIGLSFVFICISLILLLFILKNNLAIRNSISLFKSLLSSFFVSYLSVGFLTFAFYNISSDNDFPSIIGSFVNYPQLFVLVLGFSILTYMENRIKYTISISAFILFIISSIKVFDPQKHLTSVLNFVLVNGIDFTYGNLLVLFIPILFMIAGIWIYLESRNKQSILIIVGTITLFVAFLLTLLNFEKFYLIKSVVDNIITQRDFILIGLFESLYLLAFAFMGLGLLGFKKKSMQLEATQ